MRDKFVSLLNCFSAGVFCATFFMHMMPEVSISGAQPGFAKGGNLKTELLL